MSLLLKTHVFVLSDLVISKPIKTTPLLVRPEKRRMRAREGVTHPQEGYDVVLRYRLEQPWGPRETLKSGPARGEEGTNNDDPRGWPRQDAYHQVTFHSIPKPEREGRGGDFNLETTLDCRVQASLSAPQALAMPSFLAKLNHF